MTIVVDASLVIAAGLDSGKLGDWASECLAVSNLCAPHLLPAEVASAVRRQVLNGRVSADAGRETLDELGLLGIDLYPFEPLTDRVWELRDTLTAYDAWYVALAEAHDCPLATLDQRLVSAPGPRCEFVTPDS
jgi:predicted nucleic acid-binding protein